MLPMSEVARILGVDRRTLSYYLHNNKLTSERAGPKIILINPEKAREELEKAGFYKRREKKQERKSSI